MGAISERQFEISTPQDHQALTGRQPARGPTPAGRPPPSLLGRPGGTGRAEPARSAQPLARLFVTPETVLRWHRNLIRTLRPARLRPVSSPRPRTRLSAP